LLLNQPEAFRFAGAVDVSPQLARKRLRELLGPQAPAGAVRDHVPPAPTGTAIAFLTTTSSMESVFDSLVELLEKGYHVVSSTEELSYPFLRAPRLASRIERAAKRASRCVVGTGINPGFAMDVWPLILASNAQTLEHVEVVRVVDASTRRGPLQRKVGSGMSVDEFEALAEAGRIGHVGLVESCVHLADLLGWPLDRVDESLLPKRASRRLRTEHFDVPAGRVCGILHRAEGWQGKKQRIVLDLRMYLGAPEPRDEVRLRSHPPLHCVVPGGFHGDPTTASQLVSAAARIPGMPPGLHLASELPAPRRPAGRVRHSFMEREKRRSRR
jgi:4-hydroxy-tetrahydrodipicolinate reductase